LFFLDKPDLADLISRLHVSPQPTVQGAHAPPPRSALVFQPAVSVSFFAALTPAFALELKSDPFALFPDTATMEEVVRAVAEDVDYTHEDVEEDLAVLHGKRVRNVKQLRKLSKEDIKELGLPPVVARYLLRVKAGGDQ
jgi:hypothetical protein